eukprot:5365608-Prymnesium_polylepis.1
MLCAKTSKPDPASVATALSSPAKSLTRHSTLIDGLRILSSCTVSACARRARVHASPPPPHPCAAKCVLARSRAPRRGRRRGGGRRRRPTHKVEATPVGQVVAVDGGEDDVVDPPAGHRLRRVPRLRLVGRLRRGARLDGAKLAAARARVAEQHDRRGGALPLRVAVPALAD